MVVKDRDAGGSADGRFDGREKKILSGKTRVQVGVVARSSRRCCPPCTESARSALRDKHLSFLSFPRPPRVVQGELFPFSYVCSLFLCTTNTVSGEKMSTASRRILFLPSAYLARTCPLQSHPALPYLQVPCTWTTRSYTSTMAQHLLTTGQVRKVRSK